MWISEDQRDPNFKPPQNRPGVTNSPDKDNGRKKELGVIEFIVYCVISTIICFFLAIYLFIGWDYEGWQIALFLSIVPGFIIGAIIFNTQKHSSNRTASPTSNNQESPRTSNTSNNQEAPRASNTSSVSDKLIELKKLRDQDLITAEEFDKMKQEILKGLK
ncbi:MAG: hypothetical protein HDR72_00030 [Ruminococcaceae bacterium]|nr:hypothetical protein [Oscillospiraceae bacterium]